MGRRVSIPVQVVRPKKDRAEGSVPPGHGPRPTIGDRDGLPPEAPRPQETEVEGSGRPVPAATADSMDAEAAATPRRPEQDKDWRDRALRAQAEMDNYRKRQQRWAQDQIDAERQRLLQAYLQVVDDLERALAAPAVEDAPPNHGPGLRPAALRPAGLRAGVELTHRAAMQFLQKEGVEPIEARHQPFDPNWHEAVATTRRNGSGLPSGTVLQVLETGYRLDGRLLRPAKVIVAV
jgi:molecular chaperone GrpE